MWSSGVLLHLPERPFHCRRRKHTTKQNKFQIFYGVFVQSKFFCAVEVLLCWNLLCFVSFWRNFLRILKTVDVSLQKKMLQGGRWIEVILKLARFCMLLLFFLRLFYIQKDITFGMYLRNDRFLFALCCVIYFYYSKSVHL